MIIEALAPPRAIDDALRTGLAQSEKNGFAETRSLTGRRARFPHRVFVIGPQDLAEGRLPEAAVAVGWRFLLWSASGEPAAAEIEQRQDSAAPVFSHVNFGPFVQSTLDALSTLDRSRLPPLDERELRLLKAPSLQLWTLWLAGREDFFVPLAPCPKPIRPFRLYGRRELSETAARLAGKWLAEDRDRSSGSAP